mgnify:CR=1 FL=1
MFLNTLFRLLLTFNATSLLVIVFSVKSGFTLQKLFDYFGFDENNQLVEYTISYHHSEYSVFEYTTSVAS